MGQFQDGSPLKHIFGQFSHILQFLELNPKLYLGYSFRIGAATHFVNEGYSEGYIRKVGRWNSNAFKNTLEYIHSNYKESCLVFASTIYRSDKFLILPYFHEVRMCLLMRI